MFFAVKWIRIIHIFFTIKEQGYDCPLKLQTSLI